MGNIPSVELAILIGHNAFCGVRSALGMMRGLRLLRMAGGWLLVVHSVLRKDTSSSCLPMSPLPLIGRRVVVDKIKGGVLKFLRIPELHPPNKSVATLHLLL